MPFESVNALETFERLMERVLHEIARSEYLKYPDDILVFWPNFDTTLQWLTRVLDCPGEEGLKLKARKCQLFQEENRFLCHIASAREIGADPLKCEQVLTRPIPRDLSDGGMTFSCSWGCVPTTDGTF